MGATPATQKTKDKQPLDIREAVKMTVSKMGPDVSKEEKLEHAKLMVKIFEKGMSPKQAMNVSDEEMSIFYKYAYNMFNSGKYAEACELYKMLFVLDPIEASFGMSLGACYHKMKDYESAIMVYLMESQIWPYDPTPLFYCYDCYLRSNNPEGAFIMLNATIKTAQDQPRYAQLKEKAEMLLSRFDISTIKGIQFDNTPT